ncbi:fibrinogen-like protein 1 [Anguilla anguilla]|uniref:fibrinogen-like protein 1 n=1 Tax=Anguilla anguilla TaxID=7936 RepID=UPI0015A7B1C2|nr:fibrinogen-like protein 1 [Anguilla anguilla]
MPLILLLLVCYTSASSILPAEEQCLLEVAELKQNIRGLENKLLIGAWKLNKLREYSYFHLSHRLPPPSRNGTAVEPTLLPTTSGNLIVHDRDCSMLYDRLKPESGFYRIKPKSTLEPFLVFCDMSDGGGWTVIQQRRNGKVDFNRDWSAYKDGFGNFKRNNDEFWLGNERIYELLRGGENMMKIDLMDWKGERKYAMYENFRIADEEDKYRLQFGMYSGQAGDALSGGTNMADQWSISHNSMQFSTRDQDQDRYLQGSCAKENKGGWWYNRCHAANLNGKFYRGGEYKGEYDNGVVWLTWRGLWYSLRHTSMKVRPPAFMDSLGSGGGAEE